MTVALWIFQWIASPFLSKKSTCVFQIIKIKLLNGAYHLQIWPASNPGLRNYFFKFPCESSTIDFSRKCKSFPLLAYDEIQVENRKNQDVFSQKIKIPLFLECLSPQKMACLKPWTKEFIFFKFPLAYWTYQWNARPFLC